MMEVDTSFCPVNRGLSTGPDASNATLCKLLNFSESQFTLLEKETITLIGLLGS